MYNAEIFTKDFRVISLTGLWSAGFLIFWTFGGSCIKSVRRIRSIVDETGWIRLRKRKDLLELLPPKVYNMMG